MTIESCTYVIFGATGNLARLKLMPGFYHLDMENKLPEGTRIVAVGRRPWDREKWLAEVRTMLEEKFGGKLDETVFARFSERLFYHRGNLDDALCYQELAHTLNDKSGHFPRNIAFYLAISPDEFGNVIDEYAMSLYNTVHIKEAIWLVMALNLGAMMWRRRKAEIALKAGNLEEAKKMLGLIAQYMVPINITLGIIAIFIGVVLRNAY